MNKKRSMDEMPSREQLILLVNSLCKLQDKILSVKGMTKHIKQPIADKYGNWLYCQFKIDNAEDLSNWTIFEPRNA